MINVNTSNAVGEITEMLSKEKEREEMKKKLNALYGKDGYLLVDKDFSMEELEKIRTEWYLATMYPQIIKPVEEMKTIKKIGVTVVSTNDKNRYDHNYIETDTLLSATRIINTFIPKRGYRAISFKVEEVEVLV